MSLVLGSDSLEGYPYMSGVRLLRPPAIDVTQAVTEVGESGGGRGWIFTVAIFTVASV